ncbi:hypothetical protein AV530_017321 [Patagioenas fasciata monilis]|uniref:Uncharacterized protein n=1 Tax=Patagioenas fasciata monilis TaxID=372326 RepID=A0A1V4JFM2_PATFA|nr:hypothetical protein AV530_017321 [Patagioenas fasciata monilis]
MLTDQLYQDVVFHTLQEPPRLFPFCCVIFPADIWHKKYFKIRKLALSSAIDVVQTKAIEIKHNDLIQSTVQLVPWDEDS